MKNLIQVSIIHLLIVFNHSAVIAFVENDSYRRYHEQIMEAEKLAADEQFEEALTLYGKIFDSYSFVFLRDYKIAAQLAAHLEAKEKAFEIIKAGIAAGWDLKSLKKEKKLSQLQKEDGWNQIEQVHPELYAQYEDRIDSVTKEKVREMYKEDQQKALGAMLRLRDRAEVKYALSKFAPHSEAQMQELMVILDQHGYPGEQLIGNDFWMSTILSHHNSITREYVKKDTLYPFIRPQLIVALEKGQLSPYELALIEDWRIAVTSERSEPGYGFLAPPRQETLDETNSLRREVGLRSIALRNKLVEVEKKTGINFYLPDWVKGSIEIQEE
jgi:hypothetical protein